MYTSAAGSMYEELENKRHKQQHKFKIVLRRVLVILILLIVLTYLGLLLNDIKRYHNGQTPLIILNTYTKEYDDGTVVTYYSIGWLFRYYQRETITDSEIKPVWAPIRLDNVLKRNNNPNLPEIETDYTVPNNSLKYDKVEGVLFFYDNDGNLLDTYKCLLSESDCEVSISDVLTDDEDKYAEVKMGIIDNRYVFITEYKSKDTKAEEKHVYLYDINAKRIIAEYQGVRYSKLGDDKKGYIDTSKYIIKLEDKWGIDQVIKGQVSNLEGCQYNYIRFDSTNNLYIFKNSDNNWLTYNANKSSYTAEIADKITDIHIYNDKEYFITYTIDNSTYKKNYKLFNQDGDNVLSKNDIDNLTAYDNFLTYRIDNTLYFIDYDGKPIISNITLYFTDSYSSIKAYTIKIMGNTLLVSTPKSKQATHYVDEYYYDMTNWSLIKTRSNVKETTSTT
jgi:hypothetical protein